MLFYRAGCEKAENLRRTWRPETGSEWQAFGVSLGELRERDEIGGCLRFAADAPRGILLSEEERGMRDSGR